MVAKQVELVGRGLVATIGTRSARWGPDSCTVAQTRVPCPDPVPGRVYRVSGRAELDYPTNDTFRWSTDFSKQVLCF